jgi:hypothetical protein
MRAVDTSPDHAGLRESQKITGLSPSSLYRLAAIQQVRTRLVAGEAIQFHREDLARIAGMKRKNVG